MRPADSLTLTWSEPSGPSSTATFARRSSSRLDPAQQPTAGVRPTSTQQPRGVAKVQAPANGAYRESVADSFKGTGPPLPSTPIRAVGGSSSMSGILSTPEGVPIQPATERSALRKSGVWTVNRSTLELTDTPPPAGFSPASPSRFAGKLTQSNVSMSSDIDTTPIHTGKGGFDHSRNYRSTFTIGQAPEPIQPVSRPNTSYKNRSSIQFTDDPSSSSASYSTSSHDRPYSAHQQARLASDIFFVKQPSQQEQSTPRTTGKAHVQPGPSFSSNTESNGLPNHGMHTSRKNDESPALWIGGTRTPYTSTPGNGVSNHPAAVGLTPQGYNPPVDRSGSMIPQLKLSGLSGSNHSSGIPSVSSSSASSPSLVPAGVSSHDRQRPLDDPSLGNMTRRAYGNARNSSTLFQTSDMQQLQPVATIPIQVPDLPPPPKHHLKSINHTHTAG